MRREVSGMGRQVISRFLREEDGMGVVEIILIIIVLISLVIIFKSQITSLVNSILSKMKTQANSI
jgi:Flp pilus assembly pilin Flp